MMKNVKNQFTGTATQPQRNRKLCQFDKDQYCNTLLVIDNNTWLTITLCKHEQIVSYQHIRC